MACAPENLWLAERPACTPQHTWQAKKTACTPETFWQALTTASTPELPLVTEKEAPASEPSPMVRKETTAPELPPVTNKPTGSGPLGDVFVWVLWRSALGLGCVSVRLPLSLAARASGAHTVAPNSNWRTTRPEVLLVAITASATPDSSYLKTPCANTNLSLGVFFHRIYPCVLNFSLVSSMLFLVLSYVHVVSFSKTVSG